MDADYTKAVFGTLETGSSEFASTYAQVVTTVDTLDSQLRTSLGEWSGTAQTAYYECKAKWDAAIADMATVIQSLGQVIDTANINFQGAENANASMWR
jgi:WXG100 family type VII secretion target